MNDGPISASSIRWLTPTLSRWSLGSRRKKWAAGLLLGYIVLLIISQSIRLLQDDPWAAPGTLASVTFPSGKTIKGNRIPATVIRYFDTAPNALPEQPVILLIHGSPMAASSVFPRFIENLKGQGRVLSPDLPGFGFSTRQIDDYSFKTHAAHLMRFLDQLQVRRVHIVAYSMGGGAAIEMSVAKPNRIASLTLISSIGVQELELLGDYHLNHALHGLQLGAIWALQELTPHMGILDRRPINTQYARNFFDSDQRPLRALLRRVTQPTLIIHGQDDRFVPLSAAREHHRLVPQSMLKTIDGGHLVLFQKTAELAAMTSEHIANTLSGESPTLVQAHNDRINAAQAPFGQIKLPHVAGLQLFCYAALIALATLVSEDLACIGAGMLAARGIMGFVPATLAAFAGIVMGDLMLYAAGQFIGRPAIHRSPFRWFIKAEDVARAAQWFKDRGPKIIIASRFLPGSRLPVYFTAGVLGGHVWSFLFYFCIAAAIWTPGLVGLAMWTGETVMVHYAKFHQYALWVVLSTMALLWVATRICVQLLSDKGRSLLLSKTKRQWKWIMRSIHQK
jgi:membrane protein DedA with SNARE-associated domain/pimeloyl-ACP methyl ester carboxylesterase